MKTTREKNVGSSGSEEEGSMFLQNVGKLALDYTAFHARKCFSLNVLHSLLKFQTAYTKARVKLSRHENVWGMEIKLHVFLTPSSFYPEERALGTHWRGGWMGPRAGWILCRRDNKFLPLLGIEPDSPAAHLVV
jgi:hypothetical protein